MNLKVPTHKYTQDTAKTVSLTVGEYTLKAVDFIQTQVERETATAIEIERQRQTNSLCLSFCLREGECNMYDVYVICNVHVCNM